MASLTTLALARLIHEQGLPNGVLNAIHVPDYLVHKVSESDLIDGISFTGSQEVGWKIKAENPRKHVSLELGGNSVVVVTETADLEVAAKQIAYSAFAYAGQVCISAQNIFVATPVYLDFMEAFMAETKALKCGDPLEEDVVCGPLISQEATNRFPEMILKAVHENANVFDTDSLSGVAPRVLTTSGWGLSLMRQEVFAPIAICTAYSALAKVSEWIRAGEFGLHLSIYSNQPHVDFKHFEFLKMGGVIFKAPPSTRFDSMPYGGEKMSGFGREGAGYAFEHYTYWQSVVDARQTDNLNGQSQENLSKLLEREIPEH